MHLTDLFAWLYWNPDRFVFTVPLIDRPVAWYGVLFVSGFIVGYFLMIGFFTRFLFDSKKLFPLDILNWPRLLDTLTTPHSPLAKQLIQKLSITTQNKIETWQPKGLIDATTKTEILKGLNRLYNVHPREEIEKAFPDCIASVKQTSYFLADRFCWFMVIGTLVGARLGVVFFYDWAHYQNNLWEILQVWKGGLASHGGMIGLAVALYLYLRYIKSLVPTLTFVNLADYIAIPGVVTGCFIRLGNFINQEILGTPTQLPWGVVFGDPADGSLPIPRHPVQLYEALAYLMIGIILYGLWLKKGRSLRPGTLIGWTLILVFSSRIILEFWKSNQEGIWETSYLQTGQLLSIPFILIGMLFLWYSQYKRKFSNENHVTPI